MSLHIRTMTIADLSFADTVRAKVGWNQTPQDWHRLLSLEPEGCFIAEWDKQPVGTATTTCYGKELAWIGMVLVHPDFRRHGIGKALLSHGLNFLKNKPIACIKLDATPLGKTLYDQLGFKDEWTLSRWEASEIKNIPHSEIKARSLTPSDITKILELDLEIFGVSRRSLIENLIHQSHRILVSEKNDVLNGYGMLRAGSRASYLGPLIAKDTHTAWGLFSGLLQDRPHREIFWDIPDVCSAAITLAKQTGFIQQRPLIRMFLGENQNPGKPSYQWAIGDPATG